MKVVVAKECQGPMGLQFKDLEDGELFVWATDLGTPDLANVVALSTDRGYVFPGVGHTWAVDERDPQWNAPVRRVRGHLVVEGVV